MTSSVVPVEQSGRAPLGGDLPKQISRILEDFVAEKRAQFAPLGTDMDPLLNVAAHAVAGGKRLRPEFAYWGWRAADGSATETEALFRAAAAIELVHACALVHDDVIDASATRRGQRSAEHEFATLLGAGRQSASAAILLGDLLLSWSDELLHRSGFTPKILARGRQYFDLLRSEVVAGQYLDVVAGAQGRNTAADAMRIVRYKSAKYTVERPLQFGAALGSASRSLLAALSSYGIPLGEAFQLRDDVLGVFGEPDLTGKPAGDDIREGKRTLLLAHAFDQATPAQVAVLRSCVGNSIVDAADVAAVQQVLTDTGALATVETVIAELKAAALAALARTPIANEETAQALALMADRVTDRDG